MKTKENILPAIKILTFSLVQDNFPLVTVCWQEESLAYFGDSVTNVAAG